MSYNNNCNGEAANTCKNAENRSERKNKGVSGEFGEEINERKLTELDNIEATGGVVTGKRGESIHCLSIIGQIEGHYFLPEGQKATKYEHIIPMLVSIEQDEEIDGLLILLNTMGGDVEAGLAIAEVIASMRKPTVSVVLGGGHSIGVPLAVSGKRSFIVPSATMTIHPVRINGLVVGVPQTFTYFNEMQKRIIDFICAHSRANREKIHELMMRPDMMATDVGSIIEGREAVEYGIIDEVGGLDKALDALRKMIKEKRE
ncbi:MAG: ATP-dependent Clp protease proteolytic subunit [Clostridia bacterium]|nr:ATP-dependent Clp protease proteolytic subunit [Clostridia bacterium]